jgi:hypothetical protein
MKPTSIDDLLIQKIDELSYRLSCLEDLVESISPRCEGNCTARLHVCRQVGGCCGDCTHGGI